MITFIAFQENIKFKTYELTAKLELPECCLQVFPPGERLGTPIDLKANPDTDVQMSRSSTGDIKKGPSTDRKSVV